MWMIRIAAQFLWLACSPFILMATVIYVRYRIRLARRKKILRKIDKAAELQHDRKARRNRNGG